MKTLLTRVTMVLAVSCLAAGVTLAAPPMINYQGYLSDSEGNPLDTTVEMTFALYTDLIGEDTLWWEKHEDVTVEDGLFAVVLGSIELFPENLFSSPDLWLALQVGLDDEVTPRAQIITVPNAMHAAFADSADTPSNTSRSIDDGSDSDGFDWYKLTPIVLLLSALIALGTYIHLSRPIISFGLGGSPNPRGYKLNPIILNLSNTAAIGLVKLTIVQQDAKTGEGKKEHPYYGDKGAYTGNWIWDLPARAPITGNTDISSAVARAFSRQTPADKELAIIAEVFYQRFICTKYVWLRKVMAFLLRVYCSPIYKWECAAGQNWVFVPAHSRLRRIAKPSRCTFYQKLG